jgi:hypothetical protein
MFNKNFEAFSGDLRFLEEARTLNDVVEAEHENY